MERTGGKSWPERLPASLPLNTFTSLDLFPLQAAWTAGALIVTYQDVNNGYQYTANEE